jgi:hypothetical protein
MRTGAVVVSAVGGFALGALALWPANRRLLEERDDARKALAAIGPALLVKAPDIVQRSVSVETMAPPPVEATVEAAPSAGAGPDEAGGPPRRADDGRFGRGRRDDDPARDDPAVREARRREFVERMRERAESARTDFITRAELDEEKAAKIDNVVFDLNQRAESIVADWVAYVRETGSFDADYRIRFAHDLTAALVASYDALDEELPGTWRTSAGDFDLMRLIDPDVMRPMMDLQREMGVRGGMLGGMFFGGRGGPPRGEGGERREETPAQP